MVKVSKWDVIDYLKSDEDIANYLQAAINEGDSQLLVAAIGDVARAKKGINKLACDMGVGRNSLYKSLSAKSSPKFSTIFNALHSLGLEINIVVKN